jgi:hypothetical protein
MVALTYFCLLLPQRCVDMLDFWTVVELENMTGGPLLQAHAMTSVRWSIYNGSKHRSKGRICLQEHHDLEKRIVRYHFLLEARQLHVVGGNPLSDGATFDAIRIPVGCEWQTKSGSREATTIRERLPPLL